MNADYQDFEYKELTENYLKATDIKVRLLLNYGNRPEVKHLKKVISTESDL
jgi:hypothetical protein